MTQQAVSQQREGFAKLLGADGTHRRGPRGTDGGAGRALSRQAGARTSKSRGLIHDWRSSTAEILQRCLGDDEAAKFAIAANHRLLWRRSAASGMALLRRRARRVPQVGRRVHQGRLARSVDEARQGRDEAGRLGSARPRSGRRRLRWIAAVQLLSATRTPRTKEDEQRVGAKQVFANCAPHVLAHMLPDAERAKIEHAYLGQALSTSLFSAHFGLGVPPANLGLDRYGVIVLPDWATSLDQTSESARLFAADPGDRLPSYGIANYGAIDSGLAGRRPGPGHVSSASIASTIGRRFRRRTRRTGASVGSTPSRRRSTAIIPASARRSSSGCSSTPVRCTIS